MNKKDKQFLLEVELIWLSNFNGLLSSKKIKSKIKVSIPEAFGGKTKHWSPEHLFLGSICSSFMTTFFAFTKKLKAKILNLECNAIGQIEIVDGKYQFTHINVYPNIYIVDESQRKLAHLCLEKTHKQCLIINSINAEMFFHSEIHLGNADKNEKKPSF